MIRLRLLPSLWLPLAAHNARGSAHRRRTDVLLFLIDADLETLRWENVCGLTFRHPPCLCWTCTDAGLVHTAWLSVPVLVWTLPSFPACVLSLEFALLWICLPRTPATFAPGGST